MKSLICTIATATVLLSPLAHAFYQTDIGSSTHEVKAYCTAEIFGLEKEQIKRDAQSFKVQLSAQPDANGIYSGKAVISFGDIEQVISLTYHDQKSIACPGNDLLLAEMQLRAKTADGKIQVLSVSDTDTDMVANQVRLVNRKTLPVVCDDLKNRGFLNVYLNTKNPQVYTASANLNKQTNAAELVQSGILPAGTVQTASLGCSISK